MGHVLGGEKGNIFIRGRGRPTVQGGRAGGILSIPAQEVSLGSPRVGTRHVHAPTPHTPPLQAFLADFSQHSNPLMSRAVTSGRREGMFPGRYSEIFGLGERLGCVLNLGQSFDAIGAYL